MGNEEKNIGSAADEPPSTISKIPLNCNDAFVCGFSGVSFVLKPTFESK